MASVNRIRDGLDSRTRKLHSMLKSINPEGLSDKVVRLMDGWNSDECNCFVTQCMVAAVSSREALNDLVEIRCRPKVRVDIIENFMVNNKLNYPAFNFAGHLIMVGGFGDTDALINKFRAAIGGFSVWQRNPAKQTCTDDYLVNIGALALAYPYKEAVVAGKKIVDKYFEIKEREKINKPVIDMSYLKNPIPKHNSFYRPSDEDIKRDAYNKSLIEEENRRREERRIEREKEEAAVAESLRKEREVIAENRRIWEAGLLRDMKIREAKEADERRQKELAEQALEQAKKSDVVYYENRAGKRKAYVDVEVSDDVVIKQAKTVIKNSAGKENSTESEEDSKLLSIFQKCFNISSEDMYKFTPEMINSFKSQIGIITQSRAVTVAEAVSDARSSAANFDGAKTGLRKVSDNVNNDVYVFESKAVSGTKEKVIAGNKNKNLDGMVELADEFAGFDNVNYDSFGETSDSSSGKSIKSVNNALSKIVKRSEVGFDPGNSKDKQIDKRAGIKRRKDSDSDSELGSVKKRVRRISF